MTQKTKITVAYGDGIGPEIMEATLRILDAAGNERLRRLVDLNRQSLDRIVPDIAAGRIASMFEAAGWGVATVKYGRLLRELFARPGGEDLRRRIDRMGNEEYQRLLRSGPAELRERLPGTGRGARAVRDLVAGLEDAEVHAAIRDLGGHDLADLLATASTGQAAAVVLSASLWRAGRVARWVAVLPVASLLLGLPLSQLGGGAVAGAAWLAVGALLRAGALERTPAPAARVPVHV